MENSRDTEALYALVHFTALPLMDTSPSPPFCAFMRGITRLVSFINKVETFSDEKQGLGSFTAGPRIDPKEGGILPTSHPSLIFNISYLMACYYWIGRKTVVLAMFYSL